MHLISFCIDFLLSGINQLFVFVKKMWLQEEQRVDWPVALSLLWEDKHCRYITQFTSPFLESAGLIEILALY